MTDPPADSPDQTLGYAAALNELEDIVVELEDDDIDIDVLAGRVERAAALIRHCRGRIHDAEMRVEQIVAELDVPLRPEETGYTSPDHDPHPDPTP